ncbi:MAG TPA: desulfoferrodoxin FeS4 iron-binding domain-containing protein [Thermoprotei archaeon]|nr:desulfoferrodoxin FeS4 iron-binding domain-containing protein [Thermoprotei archaeon]
MTKLREIYRCNICGNIVEVINSSAEMLVCCGQPIELLSEKLEDIGLEKHVPVIEETELITDNKVYRKFLKPGEEPEVEFLRFSYKN